MPDLKMPDINRVTAAGRLTRDAELSYVGNSKAAKARFDIAVSRKYRTKDGGDTREETVYITVECWNKLAEWAGQEFKQGLPVLVEGSLKMDTWEDKATGQKRSKLFINAQRVQSLVWADNGQTATRPPKQHATAAAHSTQDDDDSFGDLQDDMPF